MLAKSSFISSKDNAEICIGGIQHTTITPNGEEIVYGDWMVSVQLSNPTTIEVDIETAFDRVNAITVKGPTTFVSVVRIRTVTNQVSNSLGRNASLSSLSASSSSPPTASQPSSSRASYTRSASAGVPVSQGSLPTRTFSSSSYSENFPPPSR